MQPTYEEVKEAYNKLQALSAKEKYKKIRSIAALAETALQSTKNIEELILYKQIFEQAGNSILINKAKVKEYSLKGITQVKTLKSKIGTVKLDSGLLAVGDPTLAYDSDYELKRVVDLMNNRNFYCIGTGSDGVYDINLRLVDIDEPLLDPSEYEFVSNCSLTSLIQIKSGVVRCADFWEVSQKGKQGVELELENSLYKVCFYLKEITEDYFGYDIVLAKTDDVELSNLKYIEDLY